MQNTLKFNWIFGMRGFWIESTNIEGWGFRVNGNHVKEMIEIYRERVKLNFQIPLFVFLLFSKRNERVFLYNAEHVNEKFLDMNGAVWV